MRIDKWKVALPIFVCATLCLYAAKKPEIQDTYVPPWTLNLDDYAPPRTLNTDDNVPPGVIKADWHPITDDFGFILQITKEPIARDEYEDMLKLIPDYVTDESRRRLTEELKEQFEGQKAMNESLPRHRVGRAQGLFFAREANKWYMVTTPPPPVGFHLLQSVEP